MTSNPIANYRTKSCGVCVCHACKDKNIRYCKNHCDKCEKSKGKLRRRVCVYQPDLD